MKNNYRNSWLLVAFACIGNFSLLAQVTPEQLQKFISDYEPTVNTKTVNISQVRSFYQHSNYKTAWVLKENTGNLDIFLKDLESSADMGLQPDDYEYEYIQSLHKGILHLPATIDSLEAETMITNSAIHFYNDVAYGNIKPAVGYNGLNYIPGCYDIPGLLAAHISGKKMGSLTRYLSDQLPEVYAMEKKIKWFNRIMADTNFREVTVTSNKVNNTNKALITKLYQLGIIENTGIASPDSILKKNITEVQRQFGLLHDGVLRNTTLQELNIPLSVRLQHLNISVNYYRWLHCLVQDRSVIVVNIPAAYLKVYNHNKVVLEMRMVVGKPSTPTPTLTSKVEEVILYPYWHVPYSIATKEILPRLKRDPGYVNTGNYQVLNASGKIVDPHSINWNSLSRNYFPYIIRQSTGCDNSLGLLKLNFYNPFGVYLHDTPNKNFFLLNKRYFSHGCMRLEKPMELGRLILKNNSVAIDTLEQKGCLYNQSPIVVQAREKMPVIVWYNPAGIDTEGRVLFYDDVYNKFGWMKKK